MYRSQHHNVFFQNFYSVFFISSYNAMPLEITCTKLMVKKAIIYSWNIFLLKTLLEARNIFKTFQYLPEKSNYLKIFDSFIEPSTQHHLSPTPNFVLIGIHSIQGWTVATMHSATRKRSTKRLKHTGNLFRKNLPLKDVC